MAAFVVFIREKTRDQAEMDAYTPKAHASLIGHPITIHAAYGRQEHRDTNSTRCIGPTHVAPTGRSL